MQENVTHASSLRDERNPLRKFGDWHSSSLAWIVLGLSALISFFAWYISYSSVQNAAQTRFSFQTEEIQSAIDKRMKEQESALWGGVGLFNASNFVDRDEWRQYVDSLQLETYLPGLQGYGYAEIVLPEDKAAHEARIRSEGFSNFSIRPEGKRELYSSIIYLEPFTDRNLRAFGYDMWSEPTRRAGMSRAIDSGEASVSGKVILVQETSSDIQRGFLMYLPVYRRGMPTETVQQRRDAIQGFVYSPFRIKDLMYGILGSTNSNIDFRIYDGADVGVDSILYDSTGSYEANLITGDEPFSGSAQIVVGGRVWEIEFRASQDFIGLAEANEPMFVAIGAIIIDILLFLTILSLSNQRKRAQHIAEGMVVELRQAKEDAELAAETEKTLVKATKESNTQLQTANEGLMRFTSIIAHDLRAPLKRIESFIKILREDYGPNLDEDGHDIIARIDRGSSRMRMMLDSMHNYSRHSNVSIEGKQANVAGVISEAVETLSSNHTDADIAVRVQPHCHVKGDAMLLQHVVQNLIANSLKFRSEKEPQIDVKAEAINGETVRISIADNGIGIEPQFAEKVFDMFARLHDEDEYEGTGIGLAICKKIITDHGGKISIDPTWQDGTRIIIELQKWTDEGRGKNSVIAA